jgi:eukaryotic-like serine/threonine-protein kinase
VPDEAELLEVASAVAEGSEIDWDKLIEPTADTPPVVQGLRVLAEIVRAMRSSSADDPAGTGYERGADAVDAVEPQDWGHLRILHRLGSGSYGVVYRAFETRLQCDVALKLAKPTRMRELDESRALKEARMIARVRHANVVSVYGADSHDGRFGLWMELVDGRTLEQALVADGPMGAHEAAHIGVELCKALAAVHQAGLLHRDIKATNVMREKGGRILLMDFGAGRPQPKADHQLLGLAGTPHYLAPELFAGASPSPASDIYSLGVLIYHLVTARYPIDAASFEAIELAHRRHEIRSLRDARPDLPSSFVSVIERALSPVTGERYQTAGAFGNALAASVGAAPSKADEQKPSPWWFEWWKPAAALAAAGLLVALWISGIGQTPAALPAALSGSGPAVEQPGTPAPLAGYEVEAAFYTLRDTERVRLGNGSAVAPGDRLFLSLNVSQAAYVYVVNEDEKNAPIVLFPLPDQELVNPIPVGLHQLPGSQRGVDRFWQVSNAGGREHFLVYVSPTRLTELESLMAAMPRAEVGRPVELSPRAVGVLRSVGGLTAAEPSPSAGTMSLAGLAPLPETRETAKGVWAREISFANP